MLDQANTWGAAISQGIIAQMRVFGGSLGVASSVIILINKIESVLSGTLTPEQLAEFYRSPLILLHFPPKQQLLAREAFIEAFREDMLLCVGIGAASFFVSLFTFQRKPPSVKAKLASLEAELASLESAGRQDMAQVEV